MGDEPIGFAEEWVVAANPKRWIDCFERCFPSSAECAFVRPRWIIEEPHIGGSKLSVAVRSKAVHTDVQDLVAAPCMLGDPRLDAIAMREVVPFEKGVALGGV
jgi:hypothetical protein